MRPVLAAALLPALLAPSAAAQLRVEGGVTGQPLDQFDTFVGTYNTAQAAALGNARLSGLDRMVGGYGGVRLTGKAGGVRIGLGAAVGALRATASVLADDASFRTFSVASTDAAVELTAGSRWLYAIADVGGRRTKLLATYADARGTSDGGNPALCRRTGRTDCLSGDYRDEALVSHAGLGVRLPVGRTGFGVAASALYPVYEYKGPKPRYYNPDDIDKPGLRYKYFDVFNEKDRCLYQSGPACVTQFPRTLDAGAPPADNYIDGLLRGVVVRVGLTYDVHISN